MTTAPMPEIRASEQLVRRGWKRRLSGALATVCLSLYVVWTVVPIAIMVLSSFKDLRDAFELPPIGDWGGVWRIVVFTPTLDHYRQLFVNDGFGLYLRNSLTAALSSAVISVTLGASAAYAISRGRFRGKQDLYFWIISTRMAPVVAVTVPLYAIFRELGLLNSVAGLVLAYTTFNLPFAIWILKGFFDSIPYDIEEAFLCDGGTRWDAFRSIIPLVVPGLAAVVVLCVLLAWNDLLFAAIMGGETAKTLPVATSTLKSSTGIRWGEIMAAGVVTAAPMLLLGVVIRKYMIQGLTMGAVRQ